MKDYYINFLNGRRNEKYFNTLTLFESYFISFESGSRLELMSKPGIPENLNDPVDKQYLGIIHLSFEVETMEMVEAKARELSDEGFKILRGPRKTGDGYYEFETLDPDGNRLEVMTKYVENQ